MLSRLACRLRARVSPLCSVAFKRFSIDSPARRKRVEQEFDRVDINKDGVISREEFYQAYAQTGVTSLVMDLVDRTGSWPTCTVDTSARDIAITMREHKTGFLVVTGTEKDSFDLQGILTEKDVILKALSATSGDMTDVPASKIMTPKNELVTVSASDSVWDLTKIFIDKNIRAAPVLHGEKLVGFVNVRDAVAQLIHDHNEDIVSMNSYIHGSY